MTTERVGYLGPEGTWSEIAALNMADGDTLVPYNSICSIVDDVNTGKLDYGVIPIENSIGGGVVDALDCLFYADNVFIISEKMFEIDHVLMSAGPLEDVKTVASHRNAISQCRSSITRLLPEASIEYSSSTAEAALRAKAEKGTAAIGNRRLSEIYGLKVIGEGISDRKGNYTRFVKVGRDKVSRTGKDRTSICVTLLENEYASLWRFLGIFAALKINLSRIESRPDPDSPGEYRFFFDMFGHEEDGTIRTVLLAIKKYCSSIRIMGSYPRQDWPHQ